MENAIKIAGAHHRRAAEGQRSPETTEGREGFVHPTGMSGSMEKARFSLIVRDFTEEGLTAKATMLENIVKDVMKDYPALDLHARGQGAISQHEDGRRPASGDRRKCN